MGDTVKQKFFTFRFKVNGKDQGLWSSFLGSPAYALKHGGGVVCRKMSLPPPSKLPFHFDIFNKTHVLAFGDVDKHTHAQASLFLFPHI